MKRRDALRSLSLAGGASLLASGRTLAEAMSPAPNAAYTQAVKGTAPVKIRNITTVLTAPNRIRLVIVKVETTEPGLVGWGCATFTQRALVVQTAIEQYLKPFLLGRERRRDRGHLAVELHELVLAQWPRPLQRDERRRHGAVGYQGEARRDAGVSAARRQGPAGRRLLLPRERQQFHGG